MKINDTKLSGIKIIEPKIFGDARGFFFESFRENRYREMGINTVFTQDNISRSNYGVVRGLHYQLQHPQAKLITVTQGQVFDVVLDIRWGSPTFGQWDAVILDDKNHRQLYIPSGFAHGFCVLSEFADLEYKCTDYYYPEDERGIIWNDPKIAIAWPKLTVTPILSPKDSRNPFFDKMDLEQLPKFVNG